MRDESTKTALLFDRLRFSRAPERSKAKDFADTDPGTMLPYIAEGSTLKMMSTTETMRSVADVFRERLMFLVDRLPNTPEFEQIGKGLHSGKPADLEKAFRELRQYAERHPDVYAGAPLLRLVSALPDGFGFWTRAVNEPVSAHKTEAKKLGVKLAERGWYKQTGATITQEIALHFAVGSLYAENLDTVAKGGSHDNGNEPLDLKALVRVYKAAREVYGAAWKKQNPDGMRLVQKRFARLEWEENNPLLNTDEERGQFDRIKKMEQLLKQVAGESKEGSSNTQLMWPLFIKKLWDDEALLQKQFSGVPLREEFDEKMVFASLPNNSHYDDPDFKATLIAIGEKLAPFAPTTPQNEEEHIALAKNALKEFGVPDQVVFKGLYDEGIRTIARRLQWEEIMKFKQMLGKKVEEPKLFDRACQFEEGFFRDFLLFEAWKQEPSKTKEVAQRYLERMQKEVPDGAKANRAVDIMNRYVRDHYQEGTVNEAKTQAGAMSVALGNPRNAEEVEEMTQADVEALNERWKQFIPGVWDASTRLTAPAQKIHHDRKQNFRQRADQEKYPPGRLLHVFSDTASRESGREAVTDTAYVMRILTEFANQDVVALQELNSKDTLRDKDISLARTWVEKYLPEPCMLRDFYLENHLNLTLWNHLKQSRLGEKLEEDGIHLVTTNVDLKDHFSGDKDYGVLPDAYFTDYTLFRVEGLAQKVHLFDEKEQAALATLIRDFSSRMTTGAQEGYERIMLELEEATVRSQYQAIYRDALPRGRTAVESEDRAARDKAFEFVLKRIVEKFPLASYNRDGLLERFALDYATTPEHARRVEEAMYTYLMRKPEVEKEKGEKVPFAPVEAVKKYLAVFKDRESRQRILGWVFGGELPDDRYLEGRTFKINSDEEREAFWLMSSAERRAVLYNALMGENGLFETGDSTEKHKVFVEFLEDFYENNFASILTAEPGKTDMEPVLRTVFFEVFKKYSTPRRVELFCAITERMREVRMKGKKLNAGQAMRLFLEQLGVVGIKAGQVISEQKGLVSDDIKEELSSLRDRAAPFSKFGVFTYLRLAELIGEPRGKVTPPFRISQVGECLGSASIKQAHLAWTTEGKPVVVKVPRPTIDKNYSEDIAVLEQVLAKLRTQGVNVPEFLLHEIVDACTSEFDFGQEGISQQETDGHLYNRKAQVTAQVQGQEGKNGEQIRLDVPDLLFLLRKGDSGVENLQLMVDEYVGGFTLKELEEWQRFASTPPVTPEEQTKKRELQQKLENIYHEYAALVGHEFTQVSVESLRAQIALDLIEQIVSDGVFHADLHSGNAIVDFKPKAKRLALIDFGSVGRSVDTRTEGVTDHRPKFKEFLQNLLFLKMGQGDASRLGELIAEYVELPGWSAVRWGTKIAEINARQAELGGFFKELLSEILAEKGEMNRQFKFLLKSLAAAGGHFEALREYLGKALPEAATRAARERKPVGEVLLQYPGMQKLRPLVEGNAQLKEMLGM